MFHRSAQGPTCPVVGTSDVMELVGVAAVVPQAEMMLGHVVAEVHALVREHGEA
jgi:hypothetical protein